MVKFISGGVTAPKGFKASGIHCGIRKNKTKKDLALSNGIDVYVELDCRESNKDWIKQSILRALDDQSRTIRIANNAINRLKIINKTEPEFFKQNGREPSMEELSEILAIPLNKIEELKTIPMETLSLDARLGDEQTEPLINFIEDKENMEDNIMKKIDFQDLLTSLENNLSSREMQILMHRYGLVDDNPKTLDQISKIIGVTRERVRQIEIKALHKSKEIIENNQKDNNKNRYFVYKNIMKK